MSENHAPSLEEKLEDIKKLVIGINQHMINSFKVVDANFESLEKRIEVIDAKLDTLIKESGESFSTVGEQLQELKVEVTKIQKVSNYSEEYENLLRVSK